MKRMFITALILIMFIISNSILAIEKLDNGVLISLHKQKENNAQLLQVQIIDDDIIHVKASPESTFVNHPELVILHQPERKIDWNVDEDENIIKINTPKLAVEVKKNSGVISFFDKNGNVLLQERSSNNKIFTPVKSLDPNTYHIQQIFNSPTDEAFYGLGAHQNDIMNYKGHDVDLKQNNMVAVNPFLVSNKNYGILWNNYSRTKFGDVRDYQSLSTVFKLYSKDGKKGGLSAEYFSDTEFKDLFTERIENSFQHEYLDAHDSYPEGFLQNVKAVRWSGEIECIEAGIHKLRLYCCGYTRLWIDNELVVDSWRQNWLPWTQFQKLEMKSGEKHHIKIEWIHTGGYIGLTALSPEKEDYSKLLSLYSEAGNEIDYYFIHGDNTDQVIKGYRTLTGKAPMMPKWAMGFWQSRERYKTQEELLSVVREFRERKIPIDNIVLDWFYWKEDQWGSHEFDPDRFEDPTGMVNELHQKLNTNIMISVWPKFYVRTKHYDEFKDHGWLYMRNIEKEQKDWVGPGYVSTFYDPYSKEARSLFWKQIEQNLYSKGFDAWWMDATEPDVQSNLSPQESMLRMTPTQLGPASRFLNTYSLMQSKAIYDGQIKTNPDKRVFILTRSAFAGQQRYSAATWSGDVASRWYDLKAQIPAGLNFCLSGIPYWTNDIGGFSVEARYENPTSKDLEEWRELNTRWYQFGTFCPLFRVHGQFPYREIFNIAPEDHPAYRAMLTYNKLRYRLIPYIYSLTAMVTFSDYTIMRALIMDFNNDKNVLNIGDQFMFGPALLINPVTEYKARSREVYLPAGSGWYQLNSNKYFNGGRSLTVDAPYTEIPVFVKEGSIIPFGPEIQYTTEKQADPIRLYIYSGADGKFTLYEDENVNNNYLKGDYSTITFNYNDKDKVLIIEERQGDYPGMLANRTFEIIQIKKENPMALDFSVQPDLVIKYNGDAQTITLR